ncbi:hypothetical protein QVZ41_06305 [Wenyingzhuangia sp. chi5]|uniref:Uncharacterized protein n=1 Tax=Wenyingzhuangia gilva TaxID=3057677 RepID=A0ABT8VR66_9FLAO|nr:hypothetical protein [Wenyingzhuangia sp. chi5]MDO3694456.1 hypothetical protein [Wenyingzhuangia sp. chi5]
MNNIKLISYKKFNNTYKNRVIENFDNETTIILNRIDFNGQNSTIYNRNELNQYSFHITENKTKNDYIIKKKEFIKKITKENPNIKLFNLRWLIKEKEYNTITYFKKGELLYDDILSNYYILTSNSKKSHNKKSKIYNLGDTCTAKENMTDQPISYYDEVDHILQVPFYNQPAATAYSNITVTGFQSHLNCDKYITTYNADHYAKGSSFGAATSEARIIQFKPFTPATGPGYCEYALAVALTLKNPFSTVTINLSFQGGSFTYSNSSSGSTTFDQTSAYINSNNLN